MKLPSTRGFPASPSATVCDHLAGHALKGKSFVEPPEPLDLAAFHGLPVSPYVRMERAQVPSPSAPAAWSSGREETKIPMSFSPPRFKTTKKGRREVKWILRLETVTVTVRTPLTAFDFIASNRGQSIKRGDLRLPLPMARADLVRLLGEAQGDAAAAELASVLPPLPPARLPRTREVTAEEKAKWSAFTAAERTAEMEAGERRRERKAAPPAKEDAPEFSAMSAEEFDAFNAEHRADASWVAIDDCFERHVERVAAPKGHAFPPAFTE